jgi:hypothetical protein
MINDVPGLRALGTHHACAYLPLIELPTVNAEGLCDHLEPLGRGGIVERYDVFDKHGVAQAVRQVEVTTEAVRHRVYRASRLRRSHLLAWERRSEATVVKAVLIDTSQAVDEIFLTLQ